MGKWRDSAVTGVDAQRQLLDELMGLNRNQDNPDAEVTDYKDRRTCKHFLCGLCPHDVFSKTKNDMGPCEGVHDDALKKQYDENKGAEQAEYERDLERVLLQHISDIDKVIARHHKRLEGEGGETRINVDLENNPEVLKLQAEIQEAEKKAEAAGEEGDVEQAQELMDKIEALQQQKAEVQGKMVADHIAKGLAPGGGVQVQDVNQKLRVCEVCGAFLSISDNDRRLADHFGGKLHLGYVKMREKLQELKEKRDKERGGGERRRERSSKDRDRERSDRERDRSRDRDSKYGRGGERSRSRDRDRRRRSRSRDRDRRRSRSGDRYRRR